MEKDVFKQLTSSVKPLPVSLQSQVLEWTEKLLFLKDKMQTKKHALEKLVQSPKPPKSAELNIELRATERMQEVCHK